MQCAVAWDRYNELIDDIQKAGRKREAGIGGSLKRPAGLEENHMTRQSPNDTGGTTFRLLQLEIRCCKCHLNFVTRFPNHLESQKYQKAVSMSHQVRAVVFNATAALQYLCTLEGRQKLRNHRLRRRHSELLVSQWFINSAAQESKNGNC